MSLKTSQGLIIVQIDSSGVKSNLLLCSRMFFNDKQIGIEIHNAFITIGELFIGLS